MAYMTGKEIGVAFNSDYTANGYCRALYITTGEPPLL